MANYEQAILITLDRAHEGGFQKDPHDHANWTGGKIGVGSLVGTKYGITTLDMPGVDIESLTIPQAEAYYREHYWKDLYSQIASQLVANKLFDLGVLFGVGTAVRVMQLTLAELNVKIDGDFGPATLMALNQAGETSVLTNYKANFATHAFNVATAKPEERRYLNDWVRRINS
jgi:lysozyme family protein